MFLRAMRIGGVPAATATARAAAATARAATATSARAAAAPSARAVAAATAPRAPAAGVAAVVAAAMAAACGMRLPAAEGPDCPQGRGGCRCARYDTCLRGLVCRDGFCEAAGGGPDGAAGVAGSGTDGDDEGAPPIDPADGRVWGYVTDAVRLPSADEVGEAYQCDVDGDGGDENALGGTLALLAGQGVGGNVQAAIDRAVTDGEAILLWALQADDLVRDDSARLAAVEGADPDGDPTDNFTGVADLAVGEGASLDQVLDGSIEEGAGRFGPGRLRIPAPLTGLGAPLDLHAVQVRAELAGGDRIRGGVLCGGLPLDAYDRDVIPALAEAFQAECDPPPTGSCGIVLALFDEDGDGRVTADDLRASALLADVLAPDLDLFAGDPAARVAGGDCERAGGGVRDPACLDSVSVGVGFSAVAARFDLAAP